REDAPPAGSALFAVRQLGRARSPEEQARVITEHRVPYRVAVSALKQMTPEVVRALVQTMSPQELINSLAGLKKRGALDDPGVKALVEGKLEQARGDGRVSAVKAEVAAGAAAGGEGRASRRTGVPQSRVPAPRP